MTLPPSLKLYLGILLLFTIGNSSDAFLLLRARELGIPLALIPALWAVLHVSKLLWSYVGGIWSDGVPRVRSGLAHSSRGAEAAGANCSEAR